MAVVYICMVNRGIYNYVVSNWLVSKQSSHPQVGLGNGGRPVILLPPITPTVPRDGLPGSSANGANGLPGLPGGNGGVAGNGGNGGNGV
jgi:hypothetical protein